MDAQSLHQHQTSTPTRRLGVKPSAHRVVEIAGNDDIEPVANRPEAPQKSEPDVEIMEVIEPVAKDEEPVVRGAEPSRHENEDPPVHEEKAVEESEPEEKPVEPEPEPEPELERPNPWTKEAVEENEENENGEQIYQYTATSAIPESRHIRVMPAQPVRDNTNIIILILLVAILIITVAIYAVTITRGNGVAKQNAQAQDVAVEEEVGHEDIYGVWRSTSGGTCFVFDDKDSFYWYASCLDEESDYHYGHFTARRGEKALNQFGLTYERVLNIITLDKKNVGVNDIYALQLNTEHTKSGGEIRSNDLSNFSIVFAHVSDNSARAYNIDTNDPYYLVKIANTAEEWRANNKIESGLSGQPEEQPADQPVEEPTETPTDQPAETPAEQPVGQPSAAPNA